MMNQSKRVRKANPKFFGNDWSHETKYSVGSNLAAAAQSSVASELHRDLGQQPQQEQFQMPTMVTEQQPENTVLQADVTDVEHEVMECVSNVTDQQVVVTEQLTQQLVGSPLKFDMLVQPVRGTEESVVVAEESVVVAEESVDVEEESVSEAEESVGLSEESVGLVEESVPLTDESVGVAAESVGTAVKSVGMAQESVEMTDPSVGLVEGSVGVAEESVWVAEESVGVAVESEGVTEHEVSVRVTEHEVSVRVTEQQVEVDVTKQDEVREECQLEIQQFSPMGTDQEQQEVQVQSDGSSKEEEQDSYEEGLENWETENDCTFEHLNSCRNLFSSDSPGESDIEENSKVKKRTKSNNKVKTKTRSITVKFKGDVDFAHNLLSVPSDWRSSKDVITDPQLLIGEGDLERVKARLKFEEYKKKNPDRCPPFSFSFDDGWKTTEWVREGRRYGRLGMFWNPEKIQLLQDNLEEDFVPENFISLKEAKKLLGKEVTASSLKGDGYLVITGRKRGRGPPGTFVRVDVLDDHPNSRLPRVEKRRRKEAAARLARCTRMTRGLSRLSQSENFDSVDC